MTAPTRIGRYEIIRRLGKSMTDVYLANDTEANRKVVIKLIPPGGDAVNQMVLEAERRGAELQKQLQALDPRMVEVYEYGDLDGFFFVAMQYVEGRNLAEVLHADHAIDPIRAAAIALEVCEQLAKFHSCEAAVVHGDIKPSNIHLGPNDTVRLLDFGIAKTLRANGDATAHHFGSPGYCSPERLSRSQVDQQSDLWAMGATLYEMLAGAPPYQAESTEKLEKLVLSHRPPRPLPGSVPRGLRAICLKAMAPEPRKRYRSARAFQADLQTFLEHSQTVAEAEQRAGWSANATIEAARAYLRKATVTMRRAKRRLRVVSGAAWFAVGMALWIGGNLGWQIWHASAAPKPQPVKPAASPAPLLTPALYIAEADRVFNAYANSANASLDAFDWQKAEVCLVRAVDLGASDNRTLEHLELSRGYATLGRLGTLQYSEAGMTQLKLYARDQFQDAARRVADDPAPHLALARLYTYSLHDASRALAEFAIAERLGAKLGPREIRQREDAANLAKPKPAVRVAAKKGRNHRWR
jgi:eukaryotic-like serine/threonine-protein kinase